MKQETEDILWSGILPLALILGVTIVGWYLLSCLAFYTRAHDAAEIAKGVTLADYAQAKTWATELLGLAGAFAGFLGIAAAAKTKPKTEGLTSQDRAQRAEGGMIGILAGATLLGIGDWPVPIALAAMATGVAADRVARAIRGK